MIKVVTIARSTLERAAGKHGVGLAFDGQGDAVDVQARTLGNGTVAVRGNSLVGDLFLSLLMVGGE